MSKLKIKAKGFTQVANFILTDKRISFKAKGLYSYLYSKPDGWDFSGDRIAKESSDGRKSVYNCLKELEKFNYITRKRLKTGRMQYELEEKPNAHKGKEPKGQRAERVSISNKDIKIIKNKSNKDIAEASSADVIPDLLKDQKKHIQIIGLYAKAKKQEFENKDQQSSFIKRNLRPAKDLIGYPGQKIIKTMQYLINEADFKWTLETVGKYIDEDLTQLKNNKKISQDELAEKIICG